MELAVIPARAVRAVELEDGDLVGIGEAPNLAAIHGAEARA
jgi:hypothetical protein